MKQVLSIDDIGKILRATKEKKDVEVKREKFIAVLCCDYEVTRRLVVEKINLLKNAGYITEEKNQDQEVILKWKK
jgi:hypothetical protein